jgi:hypothetical protein
MRLRPRLWGVLSVKAERPLAAIHAPRQAFRVDDEDCVALDSSSLAVDDGVEAVGRITVGEDRLPPDRRRPSHPRARSAAFSDWVAQRWALHVQSCASLPVLGPDDPTPMAPNHFVHTRLLREPT